MVSHIDICEKAVREAGSQLVRLLGNVTICEKSPADLVTDADLAAEKTVVEIVKNMFPSHQVLGEEASVGKQVVAPEGEYCWVIDPLDGTTNYAHNVPHFAVSLALVRHGELQVGSVYDPMRNELFSAIRGQGAWLNGQAIRTSNIESVSQAIAGIGFPPGVDKDSDDLKAFIATVSRFQAMRRTGSAALNLAYLAAGRFDAAWSYSTRVWDMAAGMLLIQEAGGRTSSPEGGDLNLWSGRFLAASTESLHGEILERFRNDNA
jgi:myo-inositol-1(or 4)-monophosphatase